MCATLIAPPGMAQVANASPFITALNDGIAYGALPHNVYFESVAQKIQETSGSPGTISLAVVRVLKFARQPACGRVAFAPYQESTKTFWGQLGGQINICEDGSPPMRMCKNAPNVLVPPDADCPDHSKPIDTQEIAAAINDALAKGGLSGQDIHNRLMEAYKKRQSAASGANNGK
jgi:hypothetical protein